MQPGILGKLCASMRNDQLDFVSLMAVPHMAGFWEKLLMPAFVYFFKILYPFHLSNSRFSKVAAAAGGCILLKTHVLEEIGGFGAIKQSLIDDCTLAQLVKSSGYRTWVGLTSSVLAIAATRGLEKYGIWLPVQHLPSLSIRSFCC